jgi:hypothetical protein
MTTLHRWPQVSTYSQSRRGPERPTWPAGISILTLGAAALLSACGGNGCDAACVADEQSATDLDGRKNIGPVNCIERPELCS